MAKYDPQRTRPNPAAADGPAPVDELLGSEPSAVDRAAIPATAEPPAAPPVDREGPGDRRGERVVAPQHEEPARPDRGELDLGLEREDHAVVAAGRDGSDLGEERTGIGRRRGHRARHPSVLAGGVTLLESARRLGAAFNRL